MDQIGNGKVYGLRKKEREMGVEISEIGVQIRKFAIFSIRTCYRSVFNHPFLVAIVVFLFFMHRSFPFLFSLFVSASPVLVCTAVLLGTLLSFGQPNIPEIEKEETTNHEILSLKTGIQGDSTVVERDESFFVERHTAKRSNAVLEESIVEASSIGTEVEKNDRNLVHSEPLIEEDSHLIKEDSREIQFDKCLTEGKERELRDSGFELKTETNKEKAKDAVFFENQYSRIEEVEDENAEVNCAKSPEESIDTSPISPWKPTEEEEEGVDDDDEASESGSDGAESSSPDASMADIIPMLDELHPLLDEDAPQPAQMSHDGSDAGSERSQKYSNVTSSSSDDEGSEHQEQEVGDEDDNDDEDEEEEETLNKEDAIKSAIKWTEDDQKNLMDLGTSELERNQRLENLIARRRARRIMAEKNLIDFESSDLPFNIPSISTTRHNPFDLPFDSKYNSIGLPPIPGSAPSILLSRRNPFDIPYDSSEEKPDLKEDGFQQEFMPFVPKEFVPKETFFRRHESFNVGPSFFGPPKHEKHDIKLSPYFEPERVGTEGMSYSSLHRQSSELSDSKVSSVSETESVCSPEDHDDKKLIEQDLSQDADLISDVGHPSEHIGHGSESSEDIESVELGQAENRLIEHDEVDMEMGDEEIHAEMASSFSERRDVAIHGEHGVGEIHLNKRTDEANYSRRSSSSSSSSEVDERIFDEKGVSSKEENIIEEPSLEESTINIPMKLVVDSQHKEPVYDSSPPAVNKNRSSSSISSDSQVETSEMGFSPVLVKRITPFEDGETEVTGQSIRGDTPSNEQISADTSNVDLVGENGLTTSGVAQKAEHILSYHELSGGEKHLESASESTAAKFDTFSDVAAHPVVIEDMVPAASCPENKSSEDFNLAVLKNEQPSVVVSEHVSGSDGTSPSESEAGEELPLDKEVALETKQDQAHSSGPDANFHVGIDQEANEELLSPHSECFSEEKLVFELEKRLPVSDKAMVESSSENHEELIVPQIIQMEPIAKVNATSKLGSSEFQPPKDELTEMYSNSLLSEVSETKSHRALAELGDNALDGVEYPSHLPVQSFNFQVKATGSQVHDHDIIEEADEIKEIDEGLLMELDAVGDFSVEEFGLNLNPIVNNRVSGEKLNSDMPSIEARTIENIDSYSRKTEPLAVKTEVEIGEVEMPHQSQIKEEIIDSGKPVLETRSIQDMDTAFRQMSEEEIKIPVVIESVHSRMVPEETKSGCSEHEISYEDSSLTATKMELPIVEATSIEDRDLASKQLHSSSSSTVDEPSIVSPTEPAEIDSDLHGGREIKQNALNGTPDLLEPKNAAETTSELHFTEARSVEDDGITLKSDFKEESGKNQSIVVGSSEEIQTSTKEHALPETSTCDSEQTDHGVQTSGDLDSSISDGKGKGKDKMKKSGKSASSSSSSSSSSDSE